MDDSRIHWHWSYWIALGIGAALWVVLWYGVGAILYVLLRLK